jgi:hypothetical protein
VSNPDYTKLYGFSNYGNANVSKQIENNLKFFLDYGLVQIGGFTNVQVDGSGIYGGQNSYLRQKNEPGYATGRVWQFYRNDLVWETGIDYHTRPIRCSGVYVNGTFYPTATTTGPYAHVVDFPRGRVIFNSPVTGVTVKAAFSYRNVQVYKSDTPWFRSIHYGSTRSDDAQFTQNGSGSWNMSAETRLELPAIVIEVSPKSTRSPYELGNLKQYVRQDVYFHVFAETDWEAKNLTDILTGQNDRTIYLVDFNAAASGAALPLNISGAPTANGQMYPDLLRTREDGGYRWKEFVFKNTTAQTAGQLPPDLFASIVKTTCEVILP